MICSELKLDEIKEVIRSILSFVPNRPFDCVYLSCIFASVMKDHFKYNAKVVTGNLLINGRKIFVQNYSLNDIGDKTQIGYWEGHCWVLLNEKYIFDLSIGRTLNSKKFKSLYPDIELPQLAGKGCLLFDINNNQIPLSYEAIGEIGDKGMTAVIQPFLRKLNRYPRVNPGFLERHH